MPTRHCSIEETWKVPEDGFALQLPAAPGQRKQVFTISKLSACCRTLAIYVVAFENGLSIRVGYEA